MKEEDSLFNHLDDFKGAFETPSDTTIGFIVVG